MITSTLFGYSNVFWDHASKYSIDEVNERQYLKSLFQHLSLALQEQFAAFNFYIFFSHDSLATPASTTIPEENKVLIWFSDESGTQPAHIRDAYLLIFKNYVQVEQGNVFANAIGYINEFEEERYGAMKKDIDVFFAGNLNSNRFDLYRLLLVKRYPFLRILNALPESVSKRVIHRIKRKILNLSHGQSVYNFSFGFKTGLAYPAYFRYLLRSVYVICPRGFESGETFRHLEALSAGCILISEPMPKTTIYSNAPFLTYNNICDLEKILKNISLGLYDEKKLSESHKAFFTMHGTVEASATRMATICRSYVHSILKESTD